MGERRLSPVARWSDEQLVLLLDNVFSHKTASLRASFIIHAERSSG
jgi:hypothetical protein